MPKLLLIICFFFLGVIASGQQATQEFFPKENRIGFFDKATSLNKKRTIGVSASVGAVGIGSMTALQLVWYENGQKNSFEVIDDLNNWLQMDKAGHIYTAYQLNRLTTDLYSWSGIKKKPSTWIGFGIALGYQTTLEVMDGYSGTWGWSWADFGSNIIGASAFTAQQLIWKEQRILPKFSYSPTPYAEIRPQVLGSNFAESLLKDYNGQTYWISFSPGSFFPNSKIPKWACLSFGYSADKKLVGSESSYFDPATGITYNEQREFLFSLDIDFSQFDIKRPWLRTIVKQFNYLKIPFPALIIRGGSLTGSPLYW